MFDVDVNNIIKRFQNARLSLMRKQPFYAVLLLHMRFALDEDCETAYTDGESIVFSPDYICKLSDKELEFVMMHEVLHVALNHVGRKLDDYDYDRYNVACDIVVNSNILYSSHMDMSSITLKEYGESMHKLPNGQEGYHYSVDEVYAIIQEEDMQNIFEQASDGDSQDSQDGQDSQGGKSGELQNSARPDGGFDDHTFWGGEGDDGNGDGEDVSTKELWLQRMMEATEIARSIMEREEGCGMGAGTMPAGAERMLKELTGCKTDWRTILDNFIQEEICDYSFCPPDKRMQDSIFLLPDFNKKDEVIKDVLFMIDSSGSMSDEMITDAFSEINGALEQFDGKLSGWIGFFDAAVIDPVPFSSVDELKIIRAYGGGGTSFYSIFEYLKEHNELEPSSIIILTDGYAEFPEESAAMRIPVLWLINNDKVKPPWGKVAVYE